MSGMSALGAISGPLSTLGVPTVFKTPVLARGTDFSDLVSSDLRVLA